MEGPPLQIEWAITLLELVLSHTSHTMGQICHLAPLALVCPLLVEEAENKNQADKNMFTIRI